MTSWTTDENGQPCKGTDTRSGSWTSSPVSFWVGDSFPVGYTASRARTFNIFEGAVVKAKLGRRVSEAHGSTAACRCWQRTAGPGQRHSGM